MKSINFLAKVVASSIVLIAVGIITAPIARADTDDDQVRAGDGNPYDSTPLSQQTLNDFSRTNRSNYSIDGSDSGLNFTDIIHNHNLFGGTTPSQFRSKSSDSINSTIEEFRAQQREQMVDAESTVN
ncbi:hypothetical protein Pse7367_3322 [Thalassoporum mexicanum PCC 7367]|uniref:hypothetical protein n=1 Tax=Thalassoporum mexicanum TaxID=3457544 RepID=UPI00029FBCB9|nr:hypothetical protein [Pseudanabaena sp. PCC 7367]AFY71562.1 hypothetical protein Pse7367_3322 [Pseudanabaena sp. PCC 7367]